MAQFGSWPNSSPAIEPPPELPVEVGPGSGTPLESVAPEPTDCVGVGGTATGSNSCAGVGGTEVPSSGAPPVSGSGLGVGESGGLAVGFADAGVDRPVRSGLTSRRLRSGCWTRTAFGSDCPPNPTSLSVTPGTTPAATQAVAAAPAPRQARAALPAPPTDASFAATPAPAAPGPRTPPDATAEPTDTSVRSTTAAAASRPPWIRLVSLSAADT